MASWLGNPFFLFCISSVFYASVSLCYEPRNQEVEALMGMKSALIDPHGVLSNWDEFSVDPCSWAMITCSPDDSVVGIEAPGQSLSGTLSAAIGNLTNLREVLLQSNNISGKLPIEMGLLLKLRTLDLSDNQFSGSIPETFGRLSSLEYLRLNNNSLTGAFPGSVAMLSQLNFLDLSYNNLNGPVPNTRARTFSVVGNPLICGGKSTDYGCSSSVISVPPSFSSGSSHGRQKSKKLAIALGVTMSCVFLIIIALVILYRRRGSHGRFMQKITADGHDECQLSLGNLRNFTFKELQNATENFSSKNILGSGGFGNVYGGKLVDGTLVAVKRLKDLNGTSGESQFQVELELISLAVHRNLLRLIGYCATCDERLLVYPYMSNGSVASRLRGKPSLAWDTRKRIAIGAARGLLYLHEQCDPKIIHRDVKAANVLLDDYCEAVVGDFGLAKLLDHADSHVTTAVRGTVGHIAPEYLSTGQSSEKTDVFGFGILLLELITGMRALELGKTLNQKGAILDWVKKVQQEKKVEVLVDRELGANYDRIEVAEMVQIALLCTQYLPSHRPKMSEVVCMLEGDGVAEKWAAAQNIHDTVNTTMNNKASSQAPLNTRDSSNDLDLSLFGANLANGGDGDDDDDDNEQSLDSFAMELSGFNDWGFRVIAEKPIDLVKQISLSAYVTSLQNFRFFTSEFVEFKLDYHLGSPQRSQILGDRIQSGQGGRGNSINYFWLRMRAAVFVRSARQIRSIVRQGNKVLSINERSISILVGKASHEHRSSIGLQIEKFTYPSSCVFSKALSADAAQVSNRGVDKGGPLVEYDRRIATGELLDGDFRQVGTLRELQRLYDELTENSVRCGLDRYASSGKSGRSRWLWSRFMPQSSYSPVKGLYLYGGVGTGKTMLMDLFFEQLPCTWRKKRIHFHDFMLNVHSRLQKHRGVSDPLEVVALEISDESILLCIDEFMVTDVADALILNRLFGHLFSNGVVLVATSNRAPDNLYEGGLQRDLFLPFIATLKERCVVREIGSVVDYRKLTSAEQGFYFVGKDLSGLLRAKFQQLLGETRAVPQEVEVVMGRTLKVPLGANGCAYFSFEELCDRPLGAADYFGLFKRFHTLALEGVPIFGLHNRTAAYRFVTLVDVMYENRARFMCTAEGSPFELFERVVTVADAKQMAPRTSSRSRKNDDLDLCVDNELGFAKDRTISRLTEMNSKEYQEQHATLLQEKHWHCVNNTAGA
ncbi:hypothetical protein Dimus_002464 [Dionaea muscipula]